MPRGTRRLVLDNFLGGLNTRDDPVDLPVNESPYTYDWVPFGEGGSIVQRDGDRVERDFTGNNIDRLRYAARPNAIIAHTTQGEVKTWDGVTQRTIYSPGGGTGHGNVLALVEAPISGGQGPVYFLARNNVGAFTMQQWDGSSASSAAWTASAGTVPTPLDFLYAGNRVWAFGGRGVLTDATIARLTWSELGDPRNWPAANTLQFDPGDGSDLTGAGKLGEILVFFKHKKAWVVYDLDTGANRPLGMDVGAKDHETIATTPIGLFFIDPARGPMITDGTRTSQLDGGTKVPWDTFVRAVYINDRIYCTINSADGLYEYHIRTKSWWRHTSSHKPLAVDLANKRLFGARATVVDEMVVANVSTFPGGVAIAPNWHSAFFSLGAPGERKRIRAVRVVGAATVQFDMMRDVGLGFDVLKTGALDAPGLYVPTAGLARQPAFEIVKISGTAVRLDQIIVDYSTRQR